MEVKKEMTEKVARLARLELTAAEVEAHSRQLSRVLDYIEQISGVEVEGVEPMIHPLEMDTPLREDEARVSPKGKGGGPKMLDAAPEVSDGGFRVPRIV